MDIEIFNGCNPGDAADVLLACGGLATGNELTTAVLMSLFTDRRANYDDAIPDGSDPRGWWADALDGRKIGSRIWLLERARDLPETYRLFEDYAKEALQWLIDDGIAAKVEVTAKKASGCNQELDFEVRITKPDGKLLAWKYRYAWDLRRLRDKDCVEVLPRAPAPAPASSLKIGWSANIEDPLGPYAETNAGTQESIYGFSKTIYFKVFGGSTVNTTIAEARTGLALSVLSYDANTGLGSFAFDNSNASDGVENGTVTLTLKDNGVALGSIQAISTDNSFGPQYSDIAWIAFSPA